MQCFQQKINQPTIILIVKYISLIVISKTYYHEIYLVIEADKPE